MAVSFDAWTDGKAIPSMGTISIEKPHSVLKLEPVSPRLKTKLIHPNKTGILSDMVWSHDGTRLIAADYPGGTVQVWEVATGKQLVKIDTKVSGFRTNTYKLNVTPDGRTIFTSFDKRNIERFERDGKSILRLKPEGGVRIWDLQTGKQTTTLQHNPPRAITSLTLAADGRYFTSHEMPGGEFDNTWPQCACLWDVKSQQRQEMPTGMNGYGVFDAKSERYAATITSGMNSSAIKIVGVPSLRELVSIPITTPRTRVHVHRFSLDGSLLIGDQQTFADIDRNDAWDFSLTFWDATTGKELMSIPTPEKGMHFLEPATSPDGTQLATVTFRGNSSHLYRIDIPSQKVIDKVSFAEGGILLSPTFSPDGRWIAVASRVIPKELERSREEDPDLFPQARIHLIDAKTGAVRETMIAPPAFINKVAFSPDGKTLATDGHGKVLLWDVSDITGSRAN